MINRTAKRRIKKILLWTEILLIVILGAGMGVVMGAFYQMNKLLPPDTVLDSYRPPVGTKIWSSDGVLLAKLAAENREPIPLERMPKQMQQAIIAIEDARFYQHSGLDYKGLVRAVFANLAEREMAQGSSTITMQLARNMFLSQRKKISRKIKEILLAVQLERNWTKRQILEAYLNQVYFGAGAYGVRAAAQAYFNKKPEDLKLHEAAMIAGLVQRPSYLSPYVALAEDGNFDRTKLRRDMVLDRMADLKFITPEECAKAKDTPIKVAKERPRSTGYFRAKYFVQHVVDHLRDRLRYDEDLLNKAGLTVITTLNWKMQQAAEKAAREGAARYRRARVSEVALVCVDPHTGYIRAMVGGVNEPWEKYQFNCATQARRHPGSAFKGFVYAAAFEAGHSPSNSVPANVIPIRMPDGTVYAPKNHGRYGGSMSYQQAFAVSANGAAVNVAVRVGPRRVAELARKMGLTGHLHAYPSLALGTTEVSPLEMASAYGVFAAKGSRAEPTPILQIRDQDGQVLEDAQPRITKSVLKPGTVEKMDLLTRSVVTSGTGRSASIVPAAHGKTGTSEEYTDAWFVGYTPDLATAVWAGNRDNSPMSRIYGGTICAPVWANFMKQAVELNPAKKKQPKLAASNKKAAPPKRAERPRFTATPFTADGNDRNRVTVSVCTETGLLARDGCPTREDSYLLGEQPMHRCAGGHKQTAEGAEAAAAAKKAQAIEGADSPLANGIDNDKEKQRPRRRRRRRRSETRENGTRSESRPARSEAGSSSQGGGDAAGVE